MGIPEHRSLPHWRFFTAIEDDLEKLSRYIEFTKSNYKCHSLEIARILMLSAAEVGVVAKQLCEQIKPGSGADNIHEFREVIISRYTSFSRNKVYMPRHGLELKPWQKWHKKQSPIWWSAYNQVKHDRHTEYQQANLKNALNAVGALLLINLHLYHTEARQGQLKPWMRLFELGEPFKTDRLGWGDRTELIAEHPDIGN